jgi:hypothetical protein
MAKLAETLVIEYLNRKGFTTAQGVKNGSSEWDILAICIKTGTPLAVHLEVQISFDPVSYHSCANAKKRTDAEVSLAMPEWFEKKYERQKIRNIRSEFFGGHWEYWFVHGVIKDERELVFLREKGVRVIPFTEIISELCGIHPRDLAFTAEGKDLVEIIRNIKQPNQRA